MQCPRTNEGMVRDEGALGKRNWAASQKKHYPSGQDRRKEAEREGEKNANTNG